MIEPDTWEYHFYDHDIGDRDCFMCDGSITDCHCGGLVHRAIVNYYDQDYRGWTDIYYRCDVCGEEWLE